ncbi:hypothetical protein LTR08_008961 [Meristemomyces frigidus]|nr:hypothetical protein LTR08_008961 [Meristemomyces frigidus]
MRASTFVPVVLSSSLVFAYIPCPLLGPVFPAPTELSQSTTFQDALGNLSSILDNVTTTGLTPYGAIPSNATSFSIGIFDAKSPGGLYSYQYSSPALQQGTEGVKQVTKDSVYRIGSGSKLITIYLFLLEVGWKYWNHPITDFVAELKPAARNCSASSNALDCMDWDEITLGALASHMAGIPRDYSTPAELLVAGLPMPVEVYGLPPVPESDFPICGDTYTDACLKNPYLQGLTAEHPVYSPFTSPVYSNGAYELLMFAFENITGKSFETTLETKLFDKLNMTKSSYNVPTNISDAVLPRGPELSGFVAELGNEIPVGGYYSSQSDLTRMGQSILSASLLSPNTIKQWMKPVTFTSNPNSAIGRPWEIFRVPELTSHNFDLYTKLGNVFSYASMLVLAPDYDSILVAGNSSTATAQHLTDTIIPNLFPALEQTARAQAHDKFAGTYESTTEGVASNITLTTQAGQPGLVIESWYSNSTNFQVAIAGVEGVQAPATLDARMYPSGLSQQTSATCQRVGFRGIFESTATPAEAGFVGAECSSWGAVDQPRYGNVGVDEFEFKVEDGEVVSVTPRALRITLKKIA